jgi:hypothetical protein
MQNKKIDEYLVIICGEELYRDEKYFKKYYINTIVYLMKTLYIDMPTEFSASSMGMNDKSNEDHIINHSIPCIYMITDGTDDIL